MIAKNDILGYSLLATEALKKDNNVVDGTLGVFYDSDESIFVEKKVQDIFNSLSKEEIFAYSQIDGGKEYLDSVKKWMFQQRLGMIEKSFNMELVATPGSTGALFLSLLLEQGTKDVLTTHIHWANYNAIVENTSHKLTTFQMFIGKKFNMNGLKNSLKKDKHNVILINDPCQNPTGYSMTLNEWKELFKLSHDFFISYILDLAYIDYASPNLAQTREFLDTFLNVSENSTLYLCFSGSKTFNAYGLRMGALIMLRKGIINENIKMLARATWSNPATPGVSLLTKIVNDKETNESFKKALENNVNELTRRSELFCKEAALCGLTLFNHTMGFFISIPSGNPDNDILKLQQHGIYLCPQDDSIRLAISKIPYNKVKGLAKRIKEILSSHSPK